MKIFEVITEDVEPARVGGFDVRTSNHAYDQAAIRGVSDQEINIALTRLNRVRREIASVPPHERFYIWDSRNKVLLGMRKTHDNTLLLNTVVRDVEDKGDRRLVKTIKVR